MEERERVLLLTGRLAEAVVRQTAAQVQGRALVDFEVHVLPITVAALMHTTWVERKLEWQPGWRFDRVLLPGYCQGETAALTAKYGVPFERGPKDILDLPEFFGLGKRKPANLDRYDIEVLAEINHAPRMSLDQILRLAEHYRQSGADRIDVGCIPGERWNGAGSVVQALVREGYRVSIDSFDRVEVSAAVEAGAELVLSVNETNVDWAVGVPAEFVIVPDDARTLDSLQPTIDAFRSANQKFRIDPILDPIGVGFAPSLGRYSEARRRWPDIPVMMGIGNVTELAEADTAGMSLLLAGICGELGVTSVLTTEVANWCQSAVQEFNIARRVIHFAIENGTIAKHIDSSLVMLRDPKLKEYGEEPLASLARQIKDPNFRIYAERGQLHVMNRDGYWRGVDAFEVFDQMAATNTKLSASHAFYLGYEMAKALTALTLGKQYQQDQALNWGLLTRPEASALERRHKAIQSGRPQSPEDGGTP